MSSPSPPPKRHSLHDAANRLTKQVDSRYTEPTRTSSSSFKPPMSKEATLKKDNMPKPQSDSTFYSAFSYMKSMFVGKTTTETATGMSLSGSKKGESEAKAPTAKASKAIAKRLKKDVKASGLVDGLNQKSIQETVSVSQTQIPVLINETPLEEKDTKSEIRTAAFSPKELKKGRRSPVSQEPEDVTQPPRYNQVRFVDNKSTYLHAPDKKGTTSFRITTAPNVVIAASTSVSPKLNKRSTSGVKKAAPIRHKKRTASPRRVKKSGSSHSSPRRLRRRSSPDRTMVRPRPVSLSSSQKCLKITSQNSEVQSKGSVSVNELPVANVNSSSKPSILFKSAISKRVSPMPFTTENVSKSNIPQLDPFPTTSSRSGHFSSELTSSAISLRPGDCHIIGDIHPVQMAVSSTAPLKVKYPVVGPTLLTPDTASTYKSPRPCRRVAVKKVPMYAESPTFPEPSMPEKRHTARYPAPVSKKEIEPVRIPKSTLKSQSNSPKALLNVKTTENRPAILPSVASSPVRCPQKLPTYIHKDCSPKVSCNLSPKSIHSCLSPRQLSPSGLKPTNCYSRRESQSPLRIQSSGKAEPVFGDDLEGGMTLAGLDLKAEGPVDVTNGCCTEKVLTINRDGAGAETECPVKVMCGRSAERSITLNREGGIPEMEGPIDLMNARCSGKSFTVSKSELFKKERDSTEMMSRSYTDSKRASSPITHPFNTSPTSLKEQTSLPPVIHDKSNSASGSRSTGISSNNTGSDQEKVDFDVDEFCDDIFIKQNTSNSALSPKVLTYNETIPPTCLMSETAHIEVYEVAFGPSVVVDKKSASSLITDISIMKSGPVEPILPVDEVENIKINFFADENTSPEKESQITECLEVQENCSNLPDATKYIENLNDTKPKVSKVIDAKTYSRPEKRKPVEEVKHTSTIPYKGKGKTPKKTTHDETHKRLHPSPFMKHVEGPEAKRVSSPNRFLTAAVPKEETPSFQDPTIMKSGKKKKDAASSKKSLMSVIGGAMGSLVEAFNKNFPAKQKPRALTGDTLAQKSPESAQKSPESAQKSPGRARKSPERAEPFKGPTEILENKLSATMTYISSFLEEKGVSSPFFTKKDPKLAKQKKKKKYKIHGYKKTSEEDMASAKLGKDDGSILQNNAELSSPLPAAVDNKTKGIGSPPGASPEKSSVVDQSKQPSAKGNVKGKDQDKTKLTQSAVERDGKGKDQDKSKSKSTKSDNGGKQVTTIKSDIVGKPVVTTKNPSQVLPPQPVAKSSSPARETQIKDKGTTTPVLPSKITATSDATGHQQIKKMEIKVPKTSILETIESPNKKQRLSTIYSGSPPEYVSTVTQLGEIP